jgi:hypothetical protein
MRRTHAFALLSLLLLAAFPCGAQMMGPLEYRRFLKRLDASAAEWREHIEALNIEELNVTFSLGKSIEGPKKTSLVNLALIHQVIDQHSTNDLLSFDVMLEESLGDVSSSVSSILSLLPDNAQAVRWARALPSLDKEINSYQGSLRDHIFAYANQLQEKAAKCSR